MDAFIHSQFKQSVQTAWNIIRLPGYNYKAEVNFLS